MIATRLPGLLCLLAVCLCPTIPAFAAPAAGAEQAATPPPAAAGRTLLSDPDASPDVGEQMPRDASSRPAHRSHTLSSDRARSAPRPAPPADPVHVLPPVIVPQIQLPATTNPASTRVPNSAPAAPKTPTSQPAAPMAPTGTTP